MATITDHYDPILQAMVYSIVGELETGELLDYTAREKLDERALRNLFDLRQARWVVDSLEQFKKNIMTSSSNLRAGMCTAFVFSNTDDFGLGRVIESYAEMFEFQANIRAFQNYDRAIDWLTGAVPEIAREKQGGNA